MIIGVISDTHSLLRPEAVDYLSDSELILHAGDIGSPDVITQLEKICPVKAIRGNIDKGPWADVYPEIEAFEVAGCFIYMLHDLKELGLDPAAGGFDVVISGHSHKPKSEMCDGVHYLNPGSAGPRRFTLPICLAKLLIDGDIITTEFHEITT